MAFAGLGCSLDIWDRLAAMLPPDVRPSTRGAWSPAIEVAARRVERGEPLPELPDPEPVAEDRPTARPRVSRSMRLLHYVASAGVEGCRLRPAADALGESMLSLNAIMKSLIAQGKVRRLLPAVPHGRNPAQRYLITEHGLEKLRRLQRQGRLPTERHE